MYRAEGRGGGASTGSLPTGSRLPMPRESGCTAIGEVKYRLSRGFAARFSVDVERASD